MRHRLHVGFGFTVFSAGGFVQVDALGVVVYGLVSHIRPTHQILIVRLLPRAILAASLLRGFALVDLLSLGSLFLGVQDGRSIRIIVRQIGGHAILEIIIDFLGLLRQIQSDLLGLSVGSPW